MSRKSKLTPQRQQRICEALRAGNTRAASAAYGGIDESTLYRWIARGEAATRGAYSEFRKAIKEAESAAEIRNVALIQKAAQETWTAAAWWLERRKPDDWARRETRRIEGHDGGPVKTQQQHTTQYDLESLDTDQLTALVDLLRAAKKGEP